MFKFRPTMTSLEVRENPSGPDLMDGSPLPPPPPSPPPQTPPANNGPEVVPANPNNPAG